MTIDVEALKHASLWNQRVCLDCEVAFDPPLDTPAWICPACGGDATVKADLALRVLEEVDQDE
jgi:rRNA maturation endonuclease Nob1